MITQQELTIFNQRQVEQIFAAQVFGYPVYSLTRCGWLDPEIIIDPSVKLFWQTVKDGVTISSDDRQADSVVTQAAAKIGILQDLVTWQQRFPMESDPGAFAQEIVRRSYLAKMSKHNTLLAQAIGSGDDQAVRDIINAMHSEIPVMQTNLTTAKEVNERFKKLVEEGIRAIPTFIPKVDTYTGGLEKKTLTVLAGRPGMGKTAFGGQVARNGAESGKFVIFFSLEMSAESLWQRWACPLVGVQWRDVMQGNISRTKKDELKSAGDDLSNRMSERLVIQDTPQTTDTIWRIAATVRPDLIVIDHIRLAKDKAENENKRLGKITENLHDLSKAQDIPVLALAQLNREAANSQPPELSALRDSGEIEENADNVWMLHRPDYYDNQKAKTGISVTEMYVRKFRNGPQDIKLYLNFDLSQEWFRE